MTATDLKQARNVHRRYFYSADVMCNAVRLQQTVCHGKA